MNGKTTRGSDLTPLSWSEGRTVRRLSYNEAEPREKRAYFACKRIFDVLASLIGLIVLSPVFLAISIAIRLDSKGGAIYTQIRTGKNGKPFTIYKFRSMCVAAEAMRAGLEQQNERDGPAFKIAEDPRVTRLGKLLRRTCVDELPQLINILRGDMSVVGPRPLPVYEARKCTAYQAGRMTVTPGLTCYWQVCDRQSASFGDWVEMDLRYIRECSLLVDLKIIFRTFFVILGRGGAK